ncbi:MAG TPA: 7TM domain-containing protein, partial [Candidatus Dojkabacteria bacterium]|nr:7TM domain-containing protein [Candidatus Dojkabacteria bacterium]
MNFTDWILAHGISISVLEIIVFIPILATIINFARYFIGFKSFGIYGPIVLALSYTFTGLRYGLLI